MKRLYRDNLAWRRTQMGGKMTRTEIYRDIAYENGKKYPWDIEEYKYLTYMTVLSMPPGLSRYEKRSMIECSILENMVIEVNEHELLVGRMANSFVMDAEKEDVIKRGWKLECELGDSCDWNSSRTSHRVVDYEKVLHWGIKGVIGEIDECLERLEETKSAGTDNWREKRDFYHACRKSLLAVCKLAKRYRELLLKKAAQEEKETRKKELETMADLFAAAPFEPCSHFYEAVQCMWLLQFCFRAVDDISLTGRFDRYMYPFYKKDIETGYITREFALEVIEQLYYKHTELYDTWPGAIMVGGVDREGKPVCNELTYMLLEAVETTGLVNPAVNVCYTEDMPEALLEKSVDLIAKGYTRPALFNDKVIQKGLMAAGVSEEDARDYVHSTCVEITPVAASDIMVATPYVNLCRAFDYILQEKKEAYEIGLLPGVRVGWGGFGPVHYLAEEIPVNLDSLDTFDKYLQLTKDVLRSTLKSSVEAAYRLVDDRARCCSSPLASALLNDCLERGLDCGNGGARYDYIYPCFPGFINLVDGLAAIRKAVYEEKRITLRELGRQCKSNFEDRSLQYYLMNQCPKFGNGDPSADTLAKDLYDFIYEELQKLSKPGKRKIFPSYFAWKAHGMMGAKQMATPDGRRAGEAMSEHLGAVQGQDKNGPTGVVASLEKLDHAVGIGGIASNFKFSREFMESVKGRTAVIEFIKVFMAQGCFEIQFNVVNRRELLEAQKEPEKYRTLMVRVAGFSDYFVNLQKNVQEEIIRRTEHEGL